MARKDENYIKALAPEDEPLSVSQYQGTRKKTMADCQLLIFQDEVREWCKQDEVLRTRYGAVLVLSCIFYLALHQYSAPQPASLARD